MADDVDEMDSSDEDKQEKPGFDSNLAVNNPQSVEESLRNSIYSNQSHNMIITPDSNNVFQSSNGMSKSNQLPEDQEIIEEEEDDE